MLYILMSLTNVCPYFYSQASYLNSIELQTFDYVTLINNRQKYKILIWGFIQHTDYLYLNYVKRY